MFIFLYLYLSIPLSIYLFLDFFYLLSLFFGPFSSLYLFSKLLLHLSRWQRFDFDSKTSFNHYMPLQYRLWTIVSLVINQLGSPRRGAMGVVNCTIVFCCKAFDPCGPLRGCWRGVSELSQRWPWEDHMGLDTSSENSCTNSECGRGWPRKTGPHRQKDIRWR